MPLPHNNATARLTMDGLGICCFNHRRQFWEVGYLRHDHHNHKLILGIEGALSTPITFDPSDRDVVIRIETINGISSYKDYPDGFFGHEPVADRTKDPTQMSDDEKENFRWAINLEDPLDEMKQGKGDLVKPSGFGVTRCFIANAVFYTRALGPKDLFNLSIGEDGSTMDDPELEEHKFGKTNNLTAADITCASDGAVNVIIDDGHGHSQIIGPLPHRPGNPWQISLRNMRPGQLSFGEHEDHDGSHGEPRKGPESRPEIGDYHLYYTAFDLDDNRKERALWGFPEFTPADSGRTDCNLVWVGTSDDLDALF
jgi:hypothetical protein